MADLVVTADNVVPVSSSSNEYETGDAGVALTAGQIVYKDSSDGGKLKLADADSATAGVRDAAGPVLNSAAVGQPARFLKRGRWNPGAAVTKGKVYCVSDTPGGIMPYEDLDVGDTVVLLAWAVDASTLELMLKNTGVTKDA